MVPKRGELYCQDWDAAKGGALACEADTFRSRDPTKAMRSGPTRIPATCAGKTAVLTAGGDPITLGRSSKCTMQAGKNKNSKPAPCPKPLQLEPLHTLKLLVLPAKSM